MSFMVNFRSAEGKPGYHPTDSLEEAIRFVEHLRTPEKVSDARVWRLQEVPIEVRTYYKVEVASAPVAAEHSPVAAPKAPRVEEEVPRPEPVSVPSVGAGPEPAVSAAPAAGPANGPGGARFGRFNRT